MLKQNNLLSFNDVWLEPQKSEIDSRAHPDLSTNLSLNTKLLHPVIASNMSSVTGKDMMNTLDHSGSIAFAHRFMTQQNLLELANNSAHMNYFGFSIGIKDEDLETAKMLYDILNNKAIVLVDIAHGFSKKMGDFVSKVKKIGFHTVIAGNVATGDGYTFLVNSGADAVRVGIAGGLVCTTSKITGHHIPTLQSVIECAEVKTSASIIADGGISSSGDAAKALVYADCVCLGSIFASTSDSPSEIIYENNQKFKLHYGMSSKNAIDKFFVNKKTHVAPEGQAIKIPYTGNTQDVLYEFLAGIKSALSYSGAKNLYDFKEKAILRHK